MPCDHRRHAPRKLTLRFMRHDVIITASTLQFASYATALLDKSLKTLSVQCKLRTVIIVCDLRSIIRGSLRSYIDNTDVAASSNYSVGRRSHRHLSGYIATV